MRFVKMHGAGNDFLIVDNRALSLPESELSALAVRFCARHTGVGADGLMAVQPARHGGDYAMLFFNADGSLGEMCGNGARCAARYGYDHGFSGEIQRIETAAGMVFGQRIEKDLYCVRLNDPTHVEPEIGIPWEGRILSVTYMELGRPGIPHAVTELPDWDELDRGELLSLGRMIRSWGVFPAGANVTFWKKTGDDRVKAVTYERGVEDLTLSCGTGAGSTAAALWMKGLLDGNSLELDFPGGELRISLVWDDDGLTDIYLTGPAVIVAEGELYI